MKSIQSMEEAREWFKKLEDGDPDMLFMEMVP